MPDNSGYFESFHEMTDAIRVRLVDDGIKEIDDIDLATMFVQCQSIFKNVEALSNQVMTEAAAIIESVRAVGKAIDDEVKRREQLELNR
ncbi:MAG: hypothetical protein KDB00_24470 [Planctomycetales bacterium]|nr:hypothetical protein [Planctomycetales bacterium]